MIRSTNGRSSLARGHGRLDPLVLDERDGLVAEHRDAMLRDPAELSIRNSVTHDALLSINPSNTIYTRSRASSWTAVAVEAHAEAQAHRRQDLLDLVERLAAEVLGLEHLAFGLLHELAQRPDVRVLQAVVRPHGQLELLDALVEVLVRPTTPARRPPPSSGWSPASSSPTKIVK